MTIARRKFLQQATAAASLPLWAKSIFAAPPALPHVRYNVLSTQGQAMVKKYAKAVEIMKTKPATDTLSWTFQWYTHSIPISKATAIQQTFGSGSSPAKTLAQAAWNTCQPHSAGQDNDNFLPWHRIFVLLFEEIIRATIHDATFTLPYWNYSPGLPGSQSGVMPATFRNSTDPLLKSLFVANRNSGVNTGSAIDTGNAGLLSAASALAKTTYSSHQPVTGFCDELDFNLHGNVHDLVGTSTNMGSVPTAGQDPIFWMHHCNIDRLWASWNKAGRKNPTDPSFLAQKFTFAGPGGTSVQMSVGQVMSIEKLNYTYDEFQPVRPILKNLAEAFSEPLVAKSPVPTATTIASASSVSLTGNTVTAPLSAPNSNSHTLKFNLAAKPPVPGVGTHYLVLKDLNVKSQPGVIYQLFLNLPANASAVQRKAHFVGFLNFFSAMPGMSMAAEDKFVSYDISDLVKTMGAAPSGPINLTVTSTAKAVEGSEPVIGSVSIVQI